jgi:hypothetical protein
MAEIAAIAQIKRWLWSPRGAFPTGGGRRPLSNPDNLTPHLSTASPSHLSPKLYPPKARWLGLHTQSLAAYYG